MNAPAFTGSAAPPHEPLRYRGFGLRIEADVPLRGLFADDRALPPDLRVWLASKPPWVEHALAQRRTPYPRADFAGTHGPPVRVVHTLGEGDFFHLAYLDGTEFVISQGGDCVFGRWSPPLTLHDTLTYLLGPILGIALRRQGRTCLHASAVAWNGRAVLFVGPARAGKSTTAAAAHIRHGAQMLTDDIVVLRESRVVQHLVEPGHAWLRLWRNSVQLLYGDEEALPPLTPNWDKRYLDASPGSGPTVPRVVPLERICLLQGRAPAATGTALLTPVSPREALVLLAANTYAAPFVDDAGRRREFQVLTELARNVPARLAPEDHAERPLDALLEAVREDLAGRACGLSA